jgi:PAS domain S-box-containing protein
VFNFKKEKKIIFIYLILAFSFIFIVDNYLSAEVLNLTDSNLINQYKEYFFVLITAVIFYLILKKYRINLNAKKEKLDYKNQKLNKYDNKTENMNKKLERSFHELNELNKRFLKMVGIVSKLNDNPLVDEDQFLSELLQNAIEIVPEADYGQIYTVDGDKIRFIDTIGHNIDTLRSVNLNKKYIPNYNSNEVIHSQNYSLDLNNIPKDKRIYFVKAFKPIKESIYIDITVSDKFIGRISLEIAKGNNKSFSKLTAPVLESFATLAASFFAFKRYDSLQGKFTKEIISSIIKMLEMYDIYTKGHSENVANLSLTIAEEMGLSDTMVLDAYWAGMVHDIGKLLIPTKVLNKKSELDDSEYNMIKHHSIWGSKSLSGSETLQHISRYILYHHEKWDGTGYPKGLKGDEIPLISQILSVADSWDAMTSNRAYRDHLSKETALYEIEKNRGSQFSPVVVDVFSDIIRNEKLDLNQRVEDKFSDNELDIKSSDGEVKLDLLFDSLAEGIIILDKEFNIQKANSSFMKIFGFSKNELIGFDIDNILVSIDKKEKLEKNLNIMASGQEVDFKMKSRKKSGDEIQLEIKAFSVDLAGKDIKYYFICKDITEFENMKREYEKIKVKYNLIFESDNIFD